MDEKIETNVGSIDALLEGGIEKGVVTEIYGAAGTGKTNFVIQSAAQVLKAGERVVIIDTEGISYSRMKQVFGENYEKFMKSIRVNRPTSFDKQLESVKNLGKLFKQKNYGLVAVDSINMYKRLESGDDKPFVKMLIGLQTLSREHNIPVLVTAQVYSGSNDEVLPFSWKSMEHIVKAIVLLRKTGTVGEREFTIKKHRSIKSEKKCTFLITGKGLE